MGLLGSVGKALGGIVGSVTGGGGGGASAAPTVVNQAPADNSGLFNYLAQQNATAQQAQLANQQQNAQLMQGGGPIGGGMPQQQPGMPPTAGGGEGYDANERLNATLAALRGY